MRMALLLLATPLACSWSWSCGSTRPPSPQRAQFVTRFDCMGIRCGGESEQQQQDDEEWQQWTSSSAWENERDPDSMNAIDQALRLDDIAPQWRPAADDIEQLPQVLTPLNQAELAELEAMPESAAGPSWSELEEQLLRQSLESLDYVGDWADPTTAKDSIVLMCEEPKVIERESGPEFTCAYDAFTAERQRLHTYITKRMLTSARTNKGPPTADADAAAAAGGGDGGAAAEAGAGGPPCLQSIDVDEQHVFIVVGVPGSGKDTVLKRYLRSLGLPLLDASADLVKEYLAAWGKDDLSNAVRANNLATGPGKHLLHAQYLHRESLVICDAVVEKALAEGKSITLEKTLFNLEPVVAYARNFRERGCKVHLLGTHIQPLRNWRFLQARMGSGQAFGRYITKKQALTGLQRYQENLEALLSMEDVASVFTSLHVYDVMADCWCVSQAYQGGSGSGSEETEEQQESGPERGDAAARVAPSSTAAAERSE